MNTFLNSFEKINWPSPVAGRFELKKVLKAGQGITTFLAADLETTAPAVVKIADRTAFSSDFMRMRLEHEANLLASIDDKRIARLITFGEDAEHVFLALNYIAGETLATSLTHGPLKPREALEIAISLTEVLELVHRHGVLHRDLKPSNIMISRDEGGRPNLTLVDFGLARSELLAPTLDEQPVGTALYVAPEQAGLFDGAVDERSDIYSLGILLYECLTGAPPFVGARVSEVLRRHLIEDLPELVLRGPNSDLAPILNELLQRLTAKDPCDRYQTVAAVHEDLLMIAKALQDGTSPPSSALGRIDKRSTLTEPSFIGRQSEVGRLLQQVETVRRGEPALIFVEAPSGAGKTRLLEEVKRTIRHNTWILDGIALSHSATQPFQVLTGVVKEVARLVKNDAARAKRLQELIGSHIDALIAALPELAVLKANEDALPSAPEEFGEIRTIAAVSAFLEALGGLDHPTLVILDDCQWADDLSLRLIRHWWSHQKTRSQPSAVMVIAAYRQENIADMHPLSQTNPAARITLAPLSPPELQKLAESMAGPLPREALDTVVRFADGSPFMAAAVLRGLAECSLLQADNNGWYFDNHAQTQVPSSLKAATLLRQRIDLLSEQTQKLLTIAAVLGKEFDITLAAKMAGQSPGLAMSAIAEVKQRYIVWETQRQERFVFVHDKLREAFLTRINEQDKRRLHGEIARLIEKDDPGNIFELAFHFDAAGESARAAPFALQAAREARQRHALNVAVQQFEIAARGLPEEDRATRCDLHQSLGDVLMLQGLYDKAQQNFEIARRLAADTRRQVSLDTGLGELAFKRGNLQQASILLEQALSLLGKPVPTRSRFTLMFHVLWEVLVQISHTLLRYRQHPRTHRPMTEEARFTSRIYNRLGYTYWFMSGRSAALWAQLRHLNLAESYAPSAELAQAYSTHGPVMTMLPWFGRALAYVNRSLEIRRENHDLWGEGQSINFLGATYYAASRFKDCIETCTQAARILERTGDRWEVNNARWNIAHSYYRLGHLHEAAKLGRETYEAAVAIGDYTYAAMCLGVWAKASGGLVPADKITALRQHTKENLYATLELLQAEALRRMKHGLWREAQKVLEESWQICQKHRLRQEYVASVLPSLLTAMRKSIEEQGAFRPCAPENLRKAQRLAKKARRIFRFYRNSLPHTLREMAYFASFGGKINKALELIKLSEQEAKRQGARAEELEAKIARSRILEAADRATPHERFKAEAELRALREGPAAPQSARTATLSILDRFDGLLDHGRSIIAARSAEDIERCVGECAVRLLRCERVLFLHLSSKATGSSEIVGHIPRFISQQLVEKTIVTGNIEIYCEDKGGSPSESLLLSDIRSAMCIPIHVNQQITACLYVAHEHVGRLFGKEDERLARFLAALAGIAFENVESFARLSELNLSLEKEIAEQRRLADELRYAKELADDANLAKSQFLANISHELKTPLTAILGYANLLVENNLLIDPGSDFMKVILRNGRKLLSLVNDILDLGQLESGQMEMIHARVNIADEINAVLANHRQRILAQGLLVDLQIAEHFSHPLVTDPLRLKQVLSSIIDNAIKFTEKGSLFISAEYDADALGDHLGGVIIRVKDSGIGIAAEQQSKIFHSFQQVDGSSTRRHGGTGLGLALSRNLAHALGGKLFLERSALGKGSTFTLILPRPQLEI